jgi:hypothetical protein
MDWKQLHENYILAEKLERLALQNTNAARDAFRESKPSGKMVAAKKSDVYIGAVLWHFDGHEYSPLIVEEDCGSGYFISDGCNYELGRFFVEEK